MESIRSTFRVTLRNSSRPGSALILHWSVFFCICFGLGYPTLNRFDPRKVSGGVDSVEYYKLVTGSPSDAGDLLRYRVLVPWVAKAILPVANRLTGSWNPVAFALLVSNSLFTATGALFLLLIGRQCVEPATALAGTLLYLLNFTIPNRQLGFGLVESGEACFMLAIFWSLFRRKFFLLPLLCALGSLAKESFVPMCACALAGWGIHEVRRGRWTRSQTIWSVVTIFIGLTTIVALQSTVAGHLIWPWQFAGDLRSGDAGLVRGLINCFTDRYFWYVFGWLLPLGLIGLRRLPGAWLYASAAGVVAALAMGAWNNAAGNTAPSIYNSVGPVLSLSAAQFLIGAAGKRSSSGDRLLTRAAQ